MAEVGDVVTVVDEQRRERQGLITAIHGWTTEEQRKQYVATQVEQLETQKAEAEDETSKARIQEWIEGAKRTLDIPFAPSAVNVVMVSRDESQRDPYGRQLERLSSLQHESGTANMVHPGRYYRL